MATFQVSLSLTPGTRTFGPFTIISGASSVKVAASRDNVSGLTAGNSAGVEVMRITTETSADGGANWLPGPGFGCAMGSVFNAATGAAWIESSNTIPVSLPPFALIRGSLTSSQSFSTTVTITTT